MTELPRWNVRLDATRPQTEYTDLLMVVAHHFKAYAEAEAFLGPYNARERGKKFYTAPTKEALRASIRQGGMNDISYLALLNGIVRFCEETKGTRALPIAHPSTVHSIQLPQPAFELSGTPRGSTMGSHVLTVPGAEPIYLNGVRAPEQIRFVILRPKLSKLGTPSAKLWEALLFNQNHGYLPQWTDSSLNPRWAGVM